MTSQPAADHSRHTPARQARFGDLDKPLPEEIRHLSRPQLWRHQADAINLIRNKQSVVIATPTASGKSRCYQLPIAESVTTGLQPGTSLLVYPTKALAQDQLRALGKLDINRLVAATYDGDATRDEKTWARSNANVILTNPEMLHYGLLPQHRKWATFLKRLDYVVVDELHTLRGVFGSHVAHVLRRLRRLCQLYGNDPTFIFSSATIGQPEVLASNLCGKEIAAVTNDGSPAGERDVTIIQPKILDEEKGIRQSPITETINTTVELLNSGRRVIVFCRSRALTEQIASGVINKAPDESSDSVRSYRGGYLTDERREIEDEIASGLVKVVVTTSALELGVDIGHLDAAVLCGFPGTIASFWQQVGRTGRSGQPSAAFLIADSDQLDQWFAAHPDQLFDRACEPAVINLTNPTIFDPHTGCAAYENPLQPTDERWWPLLDESIHRNVLADKMRIRPDQTNTPRAVWDGPGVPFARIGLRSAGGGHVSIVDQKKQQVGTVELDRAAATVHPGAIYLHRGQPWRVESLDLHARTAVVGPAEPNQTTQTRSTTTIQPTKILRHKTLGEANVYLGNVTVTTAVTGYTLRQTYSRKVLDRIDLDLPPQELQTTAVWYEWTHPFIQTAGIATHVLPGALHAAEHTAIGILPLFTICDRWDVGGVSIAEAPDTGLPTVFIYDGYPGGTGIADLAFEAASRHIDATIELLETCPCAAGCPSCIQSPKCGNGNEPLDKAAALSLLVNTLGPAEPF